MSTTDTAQQVPAHIPRNPRCRRNPEEISAQSWAPPSSQGEKSRARDRKTAPSTRFHPHGSFA
eukprot:3600662-Rhodomonas_salina.3